MTPAELEAAQHYLRHGSPEGVSYNISIRASFEELRQLSPEQCAAFMQGVAEVLSANPYRVAESRHRREQR